MCGAFKHRSVPILDPTALPKTGLQRHFWNSHFSPPLFIFASPPAKLSTGSFGALKNMFILAQCQSYQSLILLIAPFSL